MRKCARTVTMALWGENQVKSLTDQPVFKESDLFSVII